MASFGGLFASSVPPEFLRYVFFSKMTASSIVNKYTKDVIGG